MIKRSNSRNGPRVYAQLLGVDNVDTREYHGRIGDVIHIEPYAIFKVDKVLVAIRAEKAGLIEHGLATLDPKTNQWHSPPPPITRKKRIGRLRSRLFSTSP